MNEEHMIADLFEAARSEKSVRTLGDVEKFMQATTAGASSSLLIKWLKQNKMNMLITTSGLIITATIFLFPQAERSNESVMAETEQIVPVDPPSKIPLMADSTVQETFQEKETSSMKKVEVVVGEDKEEVKQTPVVEHTSEDSRLQAAKSEQLASQEASTLKEEKKQPIERASEEFSVVLVSRGGRASADAFTTYLDENLRLLQHDFSSSASSDEIRKFTLKLGNGIEANFRMQVVGFEQLELRWKASPDGEIKDLWYRIDDDEIKALDFSSDQKFSVRVKHRHQEF